MEILQEFDFDYREPTSRWAPYIEELINNPGVHAIKLVVGEDIPEKTGLANAYTGLSSYARKVGRSARVRQFDKADPPYLVVGLRPEGEAPRARRRARVKATV